MASGCGGVNLVNEFTDYADKIGQQWCEMTKELKEKMGKQNTSRMNSSRRIHSFNRGGRYSCGPCNAWAVLIFMVMLVYIIDEIRKMNFIEQNKFTKFIGTNL